MTPVFFRPATLSAIAVIAALFCEPATAQDAPAAVEKQAAAVLARNCLECHNGSDKKGQLDLTRRERALAGGESGPALDPGHPDKSLLLKRIAAGEMPEDRPAVSAAEQAVLRQWIAAGAKWDADPLDPFQFTTSRRAGYDWWSLQPIVRPTPPAIPNPKSPIRNSIDQFVLQKLRAAQLEPSPQADRRTLLRRVYFDLIGLPPSPEEMEEFLSACSPSPSLPLSPSAATERESGRGGERDSKAYEAVVDKLLDSPHYGERWARHWLDIVRYGESQGFERNKLRPNLWKYRDWVVEAFNSDLPYDDFIRWQLAGDVLRPDDPLAVVGSGFLVLGPYDLTAYNNGTPDMRAFAREEELEGLVACVCQTFLGLTVNCSRCHDHKFDPIRQTEFYQISAAIGGTYQADERECRSASGKSAAEERIAKLREEIAALDGKPDLAAQRSRLESIIRLLEGGPAHVTAPQQPKPWRVLARGDFRQPGEVVAPRGIAAVPGVSPDWRLPADAPEAERRKALAEWIAGRGNPLTPRVIVNRLWGHHFGAGLVPTPSDFGFQGGRPSHPELLDWLASELVQPSDGKPWSLKRIQRLIVLSATYRQASRFNEQAAAVDAENRLLWRQSPQRLSAETFRDALLAVSGELDRKLGGPGYRDFTISSAGNNETYTVFDAVGPEHNRRSLYRTWVRTGTSPLLDLFDCPDPSVPTPRRSVTSTPLQALAQLNDAAIEHYAQKFAERLRREHPGHEATQIRRAYELAFARQPSADEAAFGKQFAADHGLAQLCLVLFNANEFLYVD